MHHFITGAAGFIGSQLVDCLLDRGDSVSGVDDFSLGRPEHLQAARQNSRFCFYERDVSRPDQAIECLRAASGKGEAPDVIWHLAANSDIAVGNSDPSIDFNRTLQTTFAVLEAARTQGISKIAFASTSAVYGERDGLLSEDSGPLLPISNYGATKLASEALLSAAAETFVEQLWIFRFPNVVGPRATHGAIFDFMARLASRPPSLKVLGDGTQTKPYLHVAELIVAMRFIVENAQERRNVFNIGPDGAGTSVAFMAQQVIDRILPGTPIAYKGGDRGWVGDVPRFRYSTERLAALGWRPKLSSDQAVVRAIDELAGSMAR
ncbi:MAG: NAD-dependent epimerase/dehydratase family protein [Deltaproteobacteria bacterium]|nr:NAD-dependent epimerase/dehydratase family protein [Deltaproteobacteria bacterium]